MIHALERISAALVRTTEGSEALVRAVVEAAADHLSAEWVVFALVDGELAGRPPAAPGARPGRRRARPPSRTCRPRCGGTWTRCAAAPTTTCTTPTPSRRHLHVPIRLDGRVVGAVIAWTPPERQVDDTDHSVLRILAGQTAAALQNCALLDHSERLHARTTRQADALKARNDELLLTQAELGAARQREVLDNERHRIARELHDSVTQYALSAGMHIELVRSEITDERLRAPAGHGQGPDPPGRRAAPLGDLRAERRRRLRGRRGPAVDAAPAVQRAHARRAAGRGADRRQAGGAAGRLRAVAVPDRRRGAVQHRGARGGEPGGGAAGLPVRRGPADDLRRRRRAARGGAPQPARGRPDRPVRGAPRAGEHAGQGARAGRLADVPAGPAGRPAGAGGHPGAGPHRPAPEVHR